MNQPNDSGDGTSRPPHWDNFLTERSMRFYDGTYRVDAGANGYWDERHVYHRFGDQNDAEAHPPTPGPVSPAGFYGPETQATIDYVLNSNTVIATPQSLEADAQPSGPPQPDGPVSYFELRSVVPSTFLRQPSIRMRLPSTGMAYETTMLRPELSTNEGSQAHIRFLGRLEGLLIGQWKSLTKLSIEECYQLCGVEKDDLIAFIESSSLSSSTAEGRATERNAVKDEQTQPSSQDSIIKREPTMRGGAGEQDQPNGDEVSEASLSDCPSDLSDWDMHDLAKKTASRAQIEVPVSQKKHESGKKTQEGPKVSAGVRGSSVDSGVGGISTRRRSARHAKGGKDLGIAGSIAI